MKIVIIGGGPAGMLAAIAASKQNKNDDEKVNKPSQVILLEKNEKLGKKLFISGKGRCNLTNNCDMDEFFKNIVKNSKFLYSAFSEFSNEDLKKMIEDNGCPLKVERGNRVFPVSDKSYDVIDALKRALKVAGVKVKLNTEVLNIKLLFTDDTIVGDDILSSHVGANKTIVGADIIRPHRRGELYEPAGFLVTTNNGEKIIADKVIVATGGLSYPSTGSTGDGYKFAKNFSINVIDQRPSLVPFNVKEVEDCKLMQGLTLKNISIKIYEVNNIKKVLYTDFGELLFTHFGLSGPTILSASCFIDDFKDKVLTIDLKPALSIEQLDARLLREFGDNKNKKLKTIIENMLPHSMVDVYLKRLEGNIKETLDSKFVEDGQSLADLKVTEVDRLLRRKMVNLFKDLKFTLVGSRGFDEAIITRGGVDVKEINPKTMESKKIKGLYFAGEVLDVDAMTGGFNIQIACSTGYAAGRSAHAI
jgi:predicted Rossmann fold flavoprotein